MDDPSVDPEAFRDCLRHLARVNVVTLAIWPTLNFLETLRLAGRLNLGRPVVILDAGSGYGDALAAIGKWARRKGVSVKLVGIDLNPDSARIASEAYPDAARFITGDVLEFGEPADIVVSSLFAHHLANEDIVRFLAWMEERATLGWFVNDLHRHPLAFYGFGLLARIMRWHPMVQHDGPVSIARAFDRNDWRALIAQAGLADQAAQVRWHFPFRICVSRIKR